MTTRKLMTELSWDQATGMLPQDHPSEARPQGALVPNTLHNCDQVAVVYDKGQTPPEITIRAVSGSVHTVLADGVAVAVLARASGPAPSVDDVLLVERST